MAQKSPGKKPFDFRLSIRLNQEDYDRVHALAKSQNLSMAAFARQVILDKVPEDHEVRDSRSDAILYKTVLYKDPNLEKLHMHIRSISNNVNQIASRLNTFISQGSIDNKHIIAANYQIDWIVRRLQRVIIIAELKFRNRRSMPPQSQIIKK